jgi:hypothetical protein
LFKIQKKTKTEEPKAQEPKAHEPKASEPEANEPQKVQNVLAPAVQSIGERFISAIINFFPSNKFKSDDITTKSKSAPIVVTPANLCNSPVTAAPVKKQPSSVYDASKKQQTTPETPKAHSSPSIFGVASQRLTKLRDSLVLQQQISVDEDELMEDESFNSTYISTERQEVERMDWEEIPEEVILKEIQEIRETKLDTTVSRSFVPTCLPNLPSSKQQNGTEHFFIVVDTNVFLSHLKFISTFSVRKLKGNLLITQNVFP